jgi:hypothetical protein
MLGPEGMTGMARFVVPGMARLAGKVRGLWPDQNPLRRRTDRAEAAIVAGLLTVFLAGAPLAAMTAGWAAYGAASRAQHAQQVAWRQVRAVLRDAASASVYAPAQAWARWTAPDGSSRTGQVLAPAGVPAGTTVTVWVDHTGRVTGPPLQHLQVVGRQMLAAVLATVMLALALLTVGTLARRALDWRRLAAWDDEMRGTGPQWTSRR